MGALTPQPNVGLGNCPTGNCGDNDYMSFNRGKQLAQGAPMSVMEELAAASVLNHFKNDVAGARQVTDFAMTNELLKKNSEALKTATIETARESERGIVDIETLQLTNQNLIQSLDEVVKIQTEGRQKRQAAEVELARIEGELKAKLLEIAQ